MKKARTAKRASAKRSGKYMTSQKLSDYRFEKILEAFAECKEAIEVRNHAPNTVSYIFNLVRKRLLEVGYYQPVSWTGPMDKVDAGDPSEIHPLDERFKMQAYRLRGSTVFTRPPLIADMYFRAKHPEITAQELLSDIKLIIKVTGPINRPPRNLDIWKKYQAIKLYETQVSVLRRMPLSKHHHETIAGHVAEIKRRRAELREMERLRRQGKKVKKSDPKDD